MLRFVALAILFAAVCAVPISDEAKSGDLGVIVVDRNDEYSGENPNVQLLAQFEKEEIGGRHKSVMHTIGRRSAVDRIVTKYDYAHQYIKPEDVTATLIYPYPTDGDGVNVTCVYITGENQSSHDTRANVVAGGIGQRQITVAIEAKQTMYLRLVAHVFTEN